MSLLSFKQKKFLTTRKKEKISGYGRVPSFRMFSHNIVETFEINNEIRNGVGKIL